MEHATTSQGGIRSPAKVTASDGPAVGGEPGATGSGPLVDARFVARLLVAVAGSALIIFAVWTDRPTHLTGRIDLVGYGMFTDYNYVWFLAYRLVAYVFPVAVIVIYMLLDWRGPLRRTRSDSRPGPVPLIVGSPAQAQAATATSGLSIPPRLWLRLIPPAVVAGVVVGPANALSLGDGISVRIVAALLYLVVVVGVAGVASVAPRRAASARGWSFADFLLVVNAAAGALVALGGLWLVSHRTVVVLHDGATHHWPWLPWWLAALGVAAAWVWIAHQLRTGSAPGVVERRLRAVLLGSAAIYLVVAAIPGPISSFQGFDDAQNLTGAALLQRGYFPWRDFIFIHGFYPDVVSSLIGFHIFEPTEWGSTAGLDLIMTPLLWVAMYLLGVWAARRGTLVVLGTLLLAAAGALGVDPKFIGVPLTLILLGKALASPRLVWTSALTVALFIEGVAVPETDYLVIAAFVVVLAAELVHRQPGQRLAAMLRRTLCFIATGAILTAAWAVFLASQHALTAFIDWYVVFVPGHDAEGTTHPDTGYVFLNVMFALTVAVAVVTFIAAALRVRHRRAWTPLAWVMLAAALTAAVYGEQAIARFDGGHESLSVEMGLPLLVLCIASAVPTVDDFLVAQLDRGRRLRNRLGWRPQPVAVAALVVAIVLFPAIRVNVWHTPGRTRAVFDARVTRSPLGYEYPGVLAPGLLADLRTVLNTYAPRDAPFFDMTDSPGYFYYLLARRPASRFTNVSLAIPESAQRLLVDDLRKSRPPLVAFNTVAIGLGPWDGIQDEVRHFIVSQYILDRWTPVVSVRGVLFLLRNDLMASRPPLPHLTEPPITKDLYNSQQSCNWGDAANFLSSPPAGHSITVAAGDSRKVRLVSTSGWAFDTAAKKPAREVVAAVGRKAVAAIPLGTSRPDVAAYLGDASAVASGFASTVTVRTPGPVKLYALTSDGELHPLSGASSPETPPASIRMLDGSLVHVGAAGVGNVDAFSESTNRLTPFRLPASASLPSYQLATFRAKGPIGTSQLSLSDVAKAAPEGSTITAAALPVTGSQLAVRVGSCLQWHGYRGRTLYLSQHGGAPITSLTLSGVEQ